MICLFYKPCLNKALKNVYNSQLTGNKTLHNTFIDVYDGDLSWTRLILSPTNRSKIITVNRSMNAVCKGVVELIN